MTIFLYTACSASLGVIILHYKFIKKKNVFDAFKTHVIYRTYYQNNV